MGLEGRNPRRAAAKIGARESHRIQHESAEVVDLAKRRRERMRFHRPKLYPEHFIIAAIVVGSYVVAAIALL